MAKSNRLILITLHGGGRVAQVVSIGAICKAVPGGSLPEGYVQDTDHQNAPHVTITEFVFKAKLRLIPAEDESIKNIETGEPGTCEDNILDFCIDHYIKNGYTISFTGDHKPSRLDFQHRLECRGFLRHPKTKEITYGLIKL